MIAVVVDERPVPVRPNAMTPSNSEFLTTREIAELLRVKERKVYELASTGEIPCSRATGKLLFPRQAVEAWIARRSSGSLPSPGIQRPNVLLGSHDPLLEWALRESRCGLATFLDGSLDGIERFANGEGVATGLHVYASDADAWNVPLVRDRFAQDGVVLVEFAWRDRGLIVAPTDRAAVRRLEDLRGRRVVPRQPEAGSQVLLAQLLERHGIAPSELALTAPARSRRPMQRSPCSTTRPTRRSACAAWRGSTSSASCRSCANGSTSSSTGGPGSNRLCSAWPTSAGRPPSRRKRRSFAAMMSPGSAGSSSMAPEPHTR